MSNIHRPIYLSAQQFSNERDLDLIITVMSLIDEHLTMLVKSKILEGTGTEDELFEGSNPIIAVLNAKIELAYRLGLIDQGLSKDIHTAGKIRRSFAREGLQCNFETPHVKKMVLELQKNCPLLHLYEEMIKAGSTDVEQTARGVFLFIASLIIFRLAEIRNKVVRIEKLEDDTLLQAEKSLWAHISALKPVQSQN